jgi:hypothetical protein
VVIEGPLIVLVVVTDTDGSSPLVAVMVYVPGVVGEVQTFPLKVPADAVQVKLFVRPPLAVALNVNWPGAVV